MGQLDDYSLLESASDVGHLVSPLAFGSTVIPGFRHRPQQKIISDAIINAVTQRGPRFIAVSIPAQFGKSFITSYLLPALWMEWYALGMVPGGLVGLISAEDSLSMKWSVDVRRLIEERGDVFQSTLRKDSRAAGFWETSQGAGLLAIGVGGSLVGRPISLLIVDDPVKSFEQAASQRYRDSLWDWWLTVALGRLQPWTLVLVVHTRWRDDDFIGRLTSHEYEGDPDRWVYVRIPYVCDAEDDPLSRPIGEPLIRPQSDQTLEQAYDEAVFIKESSSTYSWNTMWQMNPVDPEGTIFFEKEWRYWGGDLAREERYELPDATDLDTVLMAWDMTFKDKKDNDWVVGQSWGIRGADRFLIDEVRGHWGFTETCNRVRSFADRTRAAYPQARVILVEDKANGPAVIDKLRSTIGGLVEFNPGDYGDKLQRAWACQPHLLGGNLYIPAPSEKGWVRDFVKELADFPRGLHDDRVDCATMSNLYLDKHRFEPSSWESGEDIDLTNLHATDVR